MKVSLYVDFNNQDEKGRIRLITVGSKQDIAKTSALLEEGMKVVLYDEELEVEARLERDEQFGFWIGIPLWSTRRFKD